MLKMPKGLLKLAYYDEEVEKAVKQYRINISYLILCIWIRHFGINCVRNIRKRKEEEGGKYIYIYIYIEERIRKGLCVCVHVS